MNVLFLGYGYSARKTGEFVRSQSAGNRVFGTSRTTSLADGQHEPVHFAGEAASAPLRDILAGKDARGSLTHVVGSIAPTANGDPALAFHREDILRSPTLSWLGYFSTVGVYGDHDGAWVDESAPLEPENTRSKWRVDAEAQWQALADEKGVPLFILRLAGIYGPGRSAFDKLREGTAKRIIKPGQVFNRIHVDDIGRVTAMAAERKLSGVFNLADDEPSPPQDVITAAAHMLGVEPPPEVSFATAEMSPMARSFYADNKRVSNRAIKQALGIELLYPNYREGLRGIFEGER